MSDTTKPGRLLLDDKDFVALVDADDNEVGSVPKHWDDSLITPGLKKTNRKPAGAAPSRAAARVDVDGAVEFAELEKALADAEAKSAPKA